MTGTERHVGGLIVLKCHGCKEPMLAKVESCHEPDNGDLVAKTHCRSCVAEEPLRRLSVRTLTPAQIEHQRIQLGCFEANRSADTGTNQGGQTDG
jgi:hypothetical protein